MDTADHKGLNANQAAEGDLESLDDGNKEIRSWIITAGIAAVIVLAVFLYRANKAGNEEKASRMLGEARNVQALQAIMSQYPASSAAMLARLQIAKAQYDNGDFVAAQASYREFLSQYPSHPMVAVAELGLIHCEESSGQAEKALAEYTRFITGNPKHFLTPTAIFGKARSLHALKRYDQARATYEDFLAANPKSNWKDDVEEALKQLDRESRTPSVKL